MRISRKQRLESIKDYSKKGASEYKANHLLFKSRLLTIGGIILYASWQVVATAIGANFVFNKIELYWRQTPSLFESQFSRFFCSCIIITIGIFAHRLRETSRFTYSCIEMGVAAIAAYNAANKIFTDKDPYTGIITLLGCIYVAVRACDNFKKWDEERIADEEASKVDSNNEQEISSIH